MKVKRLFRLLLPGFLAAILGVPAGAQPASVRKLSLEEAVRIAMAANPELRSAALEVQRSDARVMEAWGYAMPAVDLSGTYVHFVEKAPTYFPDMLVYPLAKLMGDSTPRPKATGALIPFPSMQPNYSMTGSVNVRQILFNGAVFIGMGAADIYSHLARELYYGKRVEIVTKARRAYYGALLAREAFGMMQSSLKSAEDNLKNVQLMRQQGILSEYDELRATVGVENLRPVVMQSETNASLALDGLRNTIGIAEEQLELTDSLTFKAVEDSVVVKAELTVLEANPGYMAVQRQIELNGAAISAERSGYLPTVAAFGSYSYSAINDKFNFSTQDFQKGAQVGLSLSMSLFQGLQTRSRVEQAQLDQRKSEEQKVNAERNLRTGVRAIIGTLRQARKRIGAQQKTVETAERGYQIVTSRFLANAATQLEVNDAQVALTQAKVNRMQAVYDYLNAAADLDQILGRLPEQFNVALD